MDFINQYLDKQLRLTALTVNFKGLLHATWILSVWQWVGMYSWWYITGQLQVSLVSGNLFTSAMCLLCLVMRYWTPSYGIFEHDLTFTWSLKSKIVLFLIWNKRVIKLLNGIVVVLVPGNIINILVLQYLFQDQFIEKWARLSHCNAMIQPRDVSTN